MIVCMQQFVRGGGSKKKFMQGKIAENIFRAHRKLACAAGDRTSGEIRLSGRHILAEERLRKSKKATKGRGTGEDVAKSPPLHAS